MKVFFDTFLFLILLPAVLLADCFDPLNCVVTPFRYQLGIVDEILAIWPVIASLLIMTLGLPLVCDYLKRFLR